jgi:UDP-glucose 4-epimerase
MDLAEGHKSSSVLEVIRAISEAAGVPIPHEFVPRRPGDAAVSYADPSAARAGLGWSATRDLAKMFEDHWRWQRNNPLGYANA